jgi:integrase
MKKPHGQSAKTANTRFRFSAERLADFAVPGDSVRVGYDQDVRELGIRVQPSGKAVFFLLKKVAGKPYRRTLGDYPDLKLDRARRHARELLNKIADWLAGDHHTPNPMVRPIDESRTFATAFEAYLKAPLKREAKHFVNREKADARRRYLFDHCFGSIANKPIDEITPVFVASLHIKLEKKYGPTMANRGHEVLRATFNHLIKKGLWTSPNPSLGATRAPKVEGTRILEDDELKPFFDALAAEANRDLAEFLALLFTVGARKSNLYSAEWAEINLPMKTWTIPKEKYKNGDTTTLMLSPEAVALFRARQRRPGADEKWVFPSKCGSASGHVQDFKNQFERVKKRAGLVDFSFHDLRRSFVANLITSGVPTPIASECAGHANLASMTPYARFAKGAVAKALVQGQEDKQRRMDAAEAEKRLLTA